MSGSPKPPSRLIAVNASPGRVSTICNVSIKALKNPLVWRSSHGNPLRGAVDGDPAAGAIAVGGVGVCGGGTPDAEAAAAISLANSLNCESGCQLAIPSFQPRSVGRKRPARSASRTCSSGNVPRLVAPRLTWIVAIMPRFNEQLRQSQSRYVFSSKRFVFSGASNARQKYQAATERCGANLLPCFKSCFGVGSFRFPNVFANPFCTP